MTAQLVKWYEKNKADNFELVMVTGDRSAKAMSAYMKKSKIKFPALEFKSTKLGKLKGFKGYPWLIMVDEKGKHLVNGVAFRELANVEKNLK